MVFCLLYGLHLSVIGASVHKGIVKENRFPYAESADEADTHAQGKPRTQQPQDDAASVITAELVSELKEAAHDLRISEKISKEQLKESMKHLRRKGSNTGCFRTAC